ncbi:MAG: pyruvate kinase [Rhodospirillales bacterium]|nr:pyruvate kinase [Rhodospirillales bacterium]
MNNIKILATLGPSSLKEDVISAMTAAGVSLFRINMSHTAAEELEDLIPFIQSCTEVPVCLDSEGAQIRTQRLVDGGVSMDANDQVRLHVDPIKGDQGKLSFHPAGIAGEFDIGDLIDIDFHGAQLRVTEKSEAFCTAVVETAGKIGENKAVSINRPIPMPAMTEKDQRAIEIGRRFGIQNFALSFANAPEDVDEFRACIGDDATLITKIESIRGIRNLVEIADKADAILIDRGDLSREVAIEKIPFLQRRIVSSVKARHKPVYVATNLLESMIEWHQPTRAEVNDVVSTLEMGAMGLVLAAETAIGDHPAAAVETIRQLIDHFDRWTPNTSFDELLSSD